MENFFCGSGTRVPTTARAGGERWTYRPPAIRGRGGYPPSTGEGEGDRAILPIGAGASPDLGAVAPAWLVTR